MFCAAACVSAKYCTRQHSALKAKVFRRSASRREAAQLTGEMNLSFYPAQRRRGPAPAPAEGQPNGWSGGRRPEPVRKYI